MTPTQKKLHEEHMARKRRLYAAAYVPPAPPPPPLPKLPTKQIPKVVFTAPPRPIPVIQKEEEDAQPVSRKEVKSLDRIMHEVSLKHKVDRFQMGNRDERERKIVAARFEYFYRCRTETDFSYDRIGKVTGHDHTSVRHGAIKYALRNQLKLPSGEASGRLAVHLVGLVGG